MSGVPQRTKEQREISLATSYANRKARKAYKELLGAGGITPEEALSTCREDPVLSRMRTREFIMSFRWIGETKAAHIMEQACIAPTRRIAGLGPKQAAALTECLDQALDRSKRPEPKYKKRDINRFKRRVASGSLSPDQAYSIVRKDRALRKMPVNEFVTSFYMVGPTRSAAILEKAAISPGKRIASLTSQQARDLLDCMNETPSIAKRHAS